MDISRTLDISEVHLKLSVDTSPDQRPHGKLGIWGPAVTTLGNFSKMPVSISITMFCTEVYLLVPCVCVWLYDLTLGLENLQHK